MGSIYWLPCPDSKRVVRPSMIPPRQPHLFPGVLSALWSSGSILRTTVPGPFWLVLPVDPLHISGRDWVAQLRELHSVIQLAYPVHCRGGGTRHEREHRVLPGQMRYSIKTFLSLMVNSRCVDEWTGVHSGSEDASRRYLSGTPRGPSGSRVYRAYTISSVEVSTSDHPYVQRCL